MVFDHFVFHNAHAGLFDSQFGQRDAHFVGCGGRRLKDFVYLLLRVGGEDLLRFAYTSQRCFHAVHDVVLLVICHCQGLLSV